MRALTRLGLVMPLVFLAWVAEKPALAAPRNVLLWVTDDQGQDAGCYGNSVIQTPNLDRLASEGTLFREAFCTTASCSASRSVILTGMFNHANGQYGHEHDYHHFRAFDGVRSLPVILGDAGYRTIRIGKYHVGPEAVFRFETVLSANDRNPVAMADACRGELAKADDRPFFLYFCTGDPHRGGGVADELPHKPDRFGNPAPGDRFAGIDEVKYDAAEVIVPPFLPDTPACRAELAQYYQSVSRVDQGLGRMIEVLKETGRYDDTLILYISDHGIAFPGAKTTVYDPGLKAPCVVRHPYAKTRGVESRAMVSWVDLAPTIVDFAQATPAAFHGRSFLPTIEQAEPAGWDEVYASHTFHEITMYYPMKVVRTRTHKLIWNIAWPLPFPFASDLWESATWQDSLSQGASGVYGRRAIERYLQRPRFELYDLAADPHEVNNLADDAAHAATLESMKSKIKDFQTRTADPWVLKWTYE